MMTSTIAIDKLRFLLLCQLPTHPDTAKVILYVQRPFFTTNMNSRRSTSILLLLPTWAAIARPVGALSMVLDTAKQTFRATPAVSPMSSVVPPTRTANRRIRIRRTRASDLHDVSTMLAMESMPGEQLNWNDSIRRLKTKSLLEKQLLHRLAAVEEGAKISEQLRSQEDYYEHDMCALSDDDTCRLIWANESFRTKLRNAVFNSQETNSWSYHNNFNLTPTRDMLNHAMMSVEELSTGDTVGFCELAWLPSPSSGYATTVDEKRMHASSDSLEVPNWDETMNSYRDETSGYFAPTILNLVTSTSHRRMGVASRMLRFASKYARTQWRCYNGDKPSYLGLYVHPENESALTLYSKRGYSVVSADDEAGLLYMTTRRSNWL